MQTNNYDVIHSRLMMFALYKACLIIPNASIGSYLMFAGILVMGSDVHM